MSKPKRCPSCGKISATRFAVLPGEGNVVCQACFTSKTGHAPLGAAGGLSTLGYFHGQYVESPKVVGPGPAGPPRVTIDGVTIHGVTIKGVTIHGVTIRGITLKGVTIAPVRQGGVA